MADENVDLRLLRTQNDLLTRKLIELQGGGGDGTSGGMEARIAKVEAHLEHVQSDLTKLGAVPADIAGMKSDIANLPTKDYLSQQFDVQFRWIVGVVTAVVALVGLIVRVTL